MKTSVILSSEKSPVTNHSNSCRRLFAKRHGLFYYFRRGGLLAFAVVAMLLASMRGEGQTTYSLCTSASDLVAGGKYLIVSSQTSGSAQALGYQATNNRRQAAVTISAGLTISLTPATSNSDTTKAFEITLGGSSGSWTLYDAANSGYLYAASSSNNYLKNQVSTSAWTITFSSNAATMTSAAQTTRNILLYNSTSSLFSCYTSGQAAVYLYKAAASSGSTPPTLTAASGATVDAPFDVTFTDDATWRAAITGITVGGTALTAGYTVSSGKITFTPSASTPAGLLQTAGSNKSIVVSATGYNTATVTQPIGVGTAAKLTMNTQPTAPASNGGALATQPKVNIADQYGNTVTVSTASVTAAVGAGSWTLNGTTSVAAVSGVASFSGLTATSTAAVTGATISFSSGTLNGITSNSFNIPAPPPANDNCSGAIELTLNGSAVTGDVSNSTQSIPAISCGGFINGSADDDVWYKFTPVETGSHSIIVTPASGFDAVIDLRSGTCNGTNVDCADAGSGGNTETLTASLTAGTTYLVRVYSYGATVPSTPTFTIRITAPPAIIVSGSLSALSTIYGTASSNTSFSVSGSGLSGNIAITPPSGFEISTSASSGFGSSVSLTPSSGAVAATTVYVRLAASTAAGSYSGNISLSSTGVNPKTVATVSSTVNAKSLNITGLSAADKNFDGNTSVSVTGTPAYDGLVNGETFPVTGSVSWAFADAGAGSNKTLVRSGSFDAPSANYTVSQPVLTAGIIAVVPGAPSINSITAGDGKLIVAFTAPSFEGGASITGYKYSTDNGSGWTAAGTTASPLIITGLTNGVTYDVKLLAVNNVGDGAASVAVQGTPEAAASPTINVIGTLSALSTTYGTASTTASFTVFGSALTDDILITPPAGFEVSVSSGSGYSTSLTLTQSGGSVPSTIVYVRLAAKTNAGSYSGDISASSAGASTITVATVTSTVNRKSLTISAPSIASRSYDGTTAAGTLTVGTLNGLVGTETLTVNGSASDYSAANVGSYSSVISYILGDGNNGGLASNYSLANGSASGNITVRVLSITAAVIADKTYNGSAVSGTVTPGDLSGFAGSETVTVSVASGLYSDANAGNGKTATITYTLSNGANGGLASNYILSPTTATGNILKANQSITGVASTMVKSIGEGTYIISAGATSGLTVSYSSSDTSVAKVASTGVVTLLSLGSATITVSQAGDGNYYAAAAQQTLTVYPNPVITATPSALAPFTTIAGTASVAQAFTLNGSSLLGDITVTAPSGYQVSADGSSYATSQTVTNSGGFASAIIYVRLTSAAAAGSYTGNISLVSSSATTVNVPLSGKVDAGCPLAIFSENMGTPTGTTQLNSNSFQNSGSLTYSNGDTTNPADVRNTSASSGYTGASGGGNIFFSSTSGAFGFSIGGINASAYSSLSLSYAYRKESGTAHATFQVDYWNGNSWVTLANTAAGLFNESATASTGWYKAKNLTLPADARINGLKIRFIKSGTIQIRIDDVSLSTISTCSPAIIAGGGPLTSLSTVYGAASSSTSFIISGANMNAGISLTPPPGFEISTRANFSDSIGTNSSPLVVGSAGNIAAITIFVRLSATAGVSGSPYSGNILCASTGATSLNISLPSGTVSKANQAISFAATDTRTFGDAAYTLNGSSGSGLPVSYSSSNTAVATVSGNILSIVGAGSTSITASQGGDANWNAAASVTQALTVNKASQTITFDSLSVKADTTAPFALTATASSGLPVSFSSSNTSVISISGSTASIAGSGTSIITASQAGNENYHPAADVSRDQVVLNTTLSDQTITFGSIAGKTYGDAPFTLNGTASSGLALSYSSSNTAVATVSGSTVTLRGAGNAVITATQGGNSSYNPATPVSQTLVVLKKTLTITGVNVEPKTYDGNTAAVLNLSSATLVGVIPGDAVTVSGGGFFDDANAGSVIGVTANLSLRGVDSFKYTLIQPINLFGDINPATQTISFSPISVQTYGGAPVTLSATASSGLTLSFESSDPTVATVANGILTIAGAGTAIITASQSGNDNYFPADDVTQTLMVNKAAQTITFGSLPTKVITDTPFTLSGRASSGLAVTYRSSNPSVATVTDSTVTLTGGVGSTVITALQAGDNNYLTADSVARTLTVAAPVLLGWDFFGQLTSPVTFAANFANAAVDTASGKNLLIRGSGASSSSGANSFRTTGFQNNGISTSNTDYFQVTIKAQTGKVLSLNSIRANLIGTATFAVAPGVRNQFAYSLDDVNFTLIDTAVVTIGTPASMAVDVSSIPALQNLLSTSKVTLRYYASGQTPTGGWGFNSPSAGVYGLSINGFSADLPAPVITSSLTASGNVGAAFNYAITASYGPVSFDATGLPSGLSVNSATGVISGTPVAAGTYPLTISATNSAGTGSANLAITVAPGNQTITFNVISPKTYGAAPFTLNGTASSGLPVSFSSSDPAVATVSGNTVTITGGGTASITASQAGDANWNAATDVVRTLTVNKASQTISFSALADVLSTDPPIILTGSASSGLPIVYSSSNSSIATVSGNVLTIVAPGTVNITASQPGDSNYSAATPVVHSLLVKDGTLNNQSISFDSLAGKTYGDAPFQLTATAGSGLAVTYTSSDVSIASVSGDMLTILKPGTVNITASQAGGSGYNAAADVTRSLIVNKKTLTVTGAVAQDKVYDGNAVATITGATLNGIVGLDAVTLSGDGSFTDADAGPGKSVTAALVLGGADAYKYLLQQPTGLSANISKAPQTISFGPLPSKMTTSAPFALNGTVSSGLAITYSSSNSAVATVSGNMVTILGVVGSTKITASQSGNTNYSAAAAVEQVLNVSSYVTWTFSNAGAADSLPVGGANVINGLTISRMTPGNSNGISTFLSTTSVSSGYSGASGTFNAGISSRNGGFDKDTSSYFSFTLTPNANKRVKLDSINFGNRSTGSGPNRLIVRSSLDNYSSNVAFDSAVAVSSSPWYFKRPVTTPVTSGYSAPVTFRIYGYNGSGATSGTVNWRIDDVTLSLFVESCSNPVDAGTVSGSSSVCVGATTAFISNGDVGGTWSSSNTAVATVNTSGVVTGVSAGNAVITYTVIGSCSPVSSSASIAVNTVVKAGTLSGSSNVCAGASTTLSSSGDPGGSWSSSDTLVAKVNSSGVVTGVSAGNVTITYTVSGACNTSSSTAPLTVIAQPNAGTVSGSSTVCLGSTATLSSDGDAGGVWSSSNTTVATVSASGIVTGLSAGNTTITYTVNGTCGSQSAGKAVTVAACSSIVNIKAFIQGYYQNGVMGSALMNSGIAGASSTQCDTITVEIHDGSNGNIIGSPVKTILNTDGTAQAVFPGLTGNHYIVLKHRSALETWSAAPVAMGNTVNYDFSTAASQAYGSTQVNVGSAAAPVFALPIGDFDRDGDVDGADYIRMESGILSVTEGYDANDLNCDGLVESEDYSLMGNNVLLGITVARPF